MLLSLGVVFAFIALGWAAFIPRGGATVRVIDFHAPLQAAQSAAPYKLVSPEGLAQRWRPTSADSTRPVQGGFHIGFVTPSDHYAAVEQGAGAPQRVVDAALGVGSVAGESATIEGAKWELRTARDGQRALVRTSGDATVVVVGTAPLEELQQLASALR